MPNQLTAALCHCLFTPMKTNLHTGVHSPYTSALLLCLGLAACLVLLCCCANQLTAALCHCLCYTYAIHTAYRFAGTIHQCTAAVFRVTCLPWSSVLLCQPADSSLVPLLCHCLFTPMKIPTAYSVHSPYTSALLQCLGLTACLVILCCCANQLTAALCHCLFTPMKIHTAYRCAFTIHQCTAAVFRVKCLPWSSVLLCQPADSSLVPLLSYTYEDPHCIQVCIHHTPVHCCSV